MGEEKANKDNEKRRKERQLLVCYQDSSRWSVSRRYCNRQVLSSVWTAATNAQMHLDFYQFKTPSSHGSTQILLLFCIFTACRGWEGTTICATLLHTAILALGERFRETRAVWTPGPLTFFSGGSLQFKSLSLWRSWNLTLTSSMLSWSRSQKPARSWEVGWGYADGSWVQHREMGHNKWWVTK